MRASWLKAPGFNFLRLSSYECTHDDMLNKMGVIALWFTLCDQESIGK